MSFSSSVTPSFLPAYIEAKAPRWMQWTLLVAAIYNAVWGAWVILSPMTLFQWMAMPLPNYPELWQCVGMIVGCYALGYALAALDPYRYWPIVLVGLVGKVLGPLGFVKAVWLDHRFSPWFGLNILTNDLVWWIPFFLILLGKYHAFQAADKIYGEALASQGEQLLKAMPYPSSEHSLWEKSFSEPLLLVFLRHTGCIYCREMLTTLADTLKEAHQLGKSCPPISIIHMSSPEEGEALLAQYQLMPYGVCAISDPERRLYKWASLPRGTLKDLFGWQVWKRGFEASLKGHRAGWLQGDGFQLSGVVRLFEGKITDYTPHPDAQTPLDTHCIRS
jgi:hypothetical protein